MGFQYALYAQDQWWPPPAGANGVATGSNGNFSIGEMGAIATPDGVDVCSAPSVLGRLCGANT